MTDRPTTVRYRTLSWLTAAAALAYLSRNAVGVAESTIREDLHLTLNQSGWFMSSFFWTYSLFQVPSGWFSERSGTRVALTAFAIAWSIATLGISAAPGFWLLILAQMLMGIAQAGIFPASCNSIGFWMPMAQRSLACGILAAGMQVGAIFASGLTGELLIPLGWRWVFIVYSIPGIVWAAGYFVRFRNRPEQDTRVNTAELSLIQAGRTTEQAEPEGDSGELSELMAIARSPVMWLLCGQQA
ncbi:MAG: MFS transporter, partial [Planctomycetaceae bacterium]|nr:MFS transporter [Planctomycetaceae bacterium]